MSSSSAGAATIGVAVVGAGMAGKAHAAAYRVAPTLEGPALPRIRRVSVADVNTALGEATARRFGFERADDDWHAVAEADDVDVVSVVVANHLHREVVEGLLAAGKHVICEKPLADSVESARAMADAAAAAAANGTIARLGFTYRRAPGVAAIRDLIQDGRLGTVRHISARYWCDYSADPTAPWTWRYGGAPGSGALADLASHIAYLIEFFGGPVRSISGGTFSTAIPRRPKPLGATVGHLKTAVSDELADVTNDDYAGFHATLAHGVATVEVSRVAHGHANGQHVEVFCDGGAALWDQSRPAEIQLQLVGDGPETNGFRRVLLGPWHPYLAGGLPMDAASVGFGQNDYFAYQARALLEEVAGLDESVSSPRNASFDEGVHNMEVLAAVATSAANDGRKVSL